MVIRANSDTISVEEAAKRLGIGRALAYELAGRGELPGVIRLGHRFVVSKAGLEKALQQDNPQPKSGSKVS